MFQSAAINKSLFFWGLSCSLRNEEDIFSFCAAQQIKEKCIFIPLVRFWLSAQRGVYSMCHPTYTRARFLQMYKLSKRQNSCFVLKHVFHFGGEKKVWPRKTRVSVQVKYIFHNSCILGLEHREGDQLVTLISHDTVSRFPDLLHYSQVVVGRKRNLYYSSSSSSLK